jgi:hypothetical protein
MGWLSLFFKSQKHVEAPTHSTSFHDLEGSPVPIKPVAVDLGRARVMVNLAAVQTAHTYGIPGHWLAFEVVTFSDAKQAYFQLQVTMKHWDEYLAAHCYAFERAVIKRICNENQEVGRAVRAVLWRVEPEAGCPYDDMPNAKAWSDAAIKQRGLVRDHINRELYALTTPASGASVGGKGPAMFSLTAEDAERAERSTLPAKYESLLDEERFDETRPATFNGFAATQPYTPEIAKGSK